MRVLRTGITKLAIGGAFAVVAMVAASARATPYTEDFNDGTADNATLHGSAVVDSQNLRLTDAVNGQQGSMIINDLDPGAQLQSFSASFDLQTGPSTTGTPADGISFTIGNTDNVGSFGESGHGSGLAVRFDAYNGGGRHIDLLRNGGVVATTNTDPYTNGVMVPVTAAMDSSGNFTLTFNGSTIFDSVATKYTATPGDQFAFGGRTGGANEQNRIDNVVIDTTASTFVAPGDGVTFQNFDTTNSTIYTADRFDSAPAASIEADGPDGNFLRIAKDGVGNQRNTVAFDRSIAGSEWLAGLEIEFDFRMGGDGDGADGMGFVLLNTADFGTSGGLGLVFDPEDPNLANSFGIGLDSHDNDGAGTGELGQDSVTLHFNGSKVVEVDLTGQMDLENNLFNRALVRITPGVGGSYVTMRVIEDYFGTQKTIDVFINQFVAGMDPYEWRAAFGARSGGLNDNHDLDNVRISVVPEPMTMLAVGLSLTGLGGYVRKRRRA